jgi:PhnB protein
MPVKPTPDTSPRVMPILVCRDPEAEIDFCERVLQASVAVRRPGPDGRTTHAALALGEARIIIQAEIPQLSSTAPEPDGSSPVVIFAYVEDVDRAVEMTLAAGGIVLLPAQDQFWGDRSARIMDPSGHVWTIASRIETRRNSSEQNVGTTFGKTRTRSDRRTTASWFLRHASSCRLLRVSARGVPCYPATLSRGIRRRGFGQNAG